MFTINHVESNGHSSLRLAKWVTHDPDLNIVTAGMAIDDKNEDGEYHATFGNGVVYVMNSGGKTVAKYIL